MADPHPSGFIDNHVIGTVHMHCLRGVKSDIIDLVQSSFNEKDVYADLCEIHTFMNYEKPACRFGLEVRL